MRKIFALTLFSISAAAQASIGLENPATLYTQSFDSLAATGSSVSWTNDVTIKGWFLFRQPATAPTALTTYSTGSGGSSAGSVVSYGAASSTERALGAVGSGGSYWGSPASGAVAGWIAAAFTNNTGSRITGFSVSYDGEQWRRSETNAAQSMILEYGFGNSFETVSSWTAAGSAFNFVSPRTGTTAIALDGNDGSNRTGALGGSVVADWSVDETMWIRWIERNDTGFDHGLAIDNFSLGVTAVPEPETFALMLAGLGLVGALARRAR